MPIGASFCGPPPRLPNPSHLPTPPTTSATDDIMATPSTRQKRGRVAGVKRAFQEISKNLVESMEKTAQHRSVEQKQQIEELLALQERQTKAAEEKTVVLQDSISTLTNLVGAFLAKQEQG
ncbi:hypothetical protein GOP47_0029661 [Adiantum capillus-veneris]|nr:hypothetical protein GOP47_0029661 [Adiantum capillus-veneris]